MPTSERIKEIAHRTCRRYRHVEECKYQFDEFTLVEFAKKLLSEVKSTCNMQSTLINDQMAINFHEALTDGSISESDLKDIKIGLNAAFANINLENILKQEEEFIFKHIKLFEGEFNLGAVESIIFEICGIKVSCLNDGFIKTIKWQEYYQFKASIK